MRLYLTAGGAAVIRSMPMDWKLRPNARFQGAKGPVVLVVLDGVGVGKGDEADAVKLAATPTLDRLWSEGARCTLAAHGAAVGLPSADDMGNSEVGHNALGCGRIYEQGASLVNRAIETDALFAGQTWTDIVARCRQNHSALHFIGLLSDGNVHSHIAHLIALLRRAAQEGIERLYVHALLDGRDVPATSALEYVDRIEVALAELRQQAGCTAAIASGGGRMLVTMDRYEADWSIVARGYDAHVHGRARPFPSARQAVLTFREEDPGIGDQFLPAFTIVENGEPIGRIRDGDAVINFNFRGDRAIEISRAFEDEAFSHFVREPRPDVLYAGMMEYDGDLHIPKRYLVTPPAIDRTMGEYLAHNQVTQLALSETQKYGHVTYFWNGNRSGKFDDALETYIEIPSDRVPFEERPWMKAAEITDRLIEELRTGKHRLARVNYANGDMVGHTGVFEATVIAVEAVDLQLGRLVRAVDQLDGVVVVTADHGNADEMYQRDKQGRVVRDSVTGQPVVKTSHTLNPVPFMVHDPNRRDQYRVAESPTGAGIANVTATCLELLGFEPPADFQPSLLRFK
jgi:2,3-bisphosphoglycerate-independent phosphoglycerate mutase